MATVMPRIAATGDESLLTVIPVTSILGIRQPVDAAPPNTPPARSAERPSAPVVVEPYVWLAKSQADRYLNTPRAMMGRRFTCKPPNAEDENLEGDWQLMSHAVRIGDEDTVEDEYQVRFEGSSDGSVAMDRDEVQYLLAFSFVSS